MRGSESNGILCLVLMLIASCSLPYAAAFVQESESEYLEKFNSIIGHSYSSTADSSFAPQGLEECKALGFLTDPEDVEVTVTGSGTVSAASVADQCGSKARCIIPSGLTLRMDSSLNLVALIVRGRVEWTGATQNSEHQWLCAGYVAVEENGEFFLDVQSAAVAWIFIKDNGATHPMLRSRAFGAAAAKGSGFSPTIDISGRSFDRTWSLLAFPTSVGDTSLRLLHNPVAMGWQIGDRIAVASTRPRSQGTSQSFRITAFGSQNSVELSDPFLDAHDAQHFLGGGGSAALRAAEVVNLQRNVIISGDDFRHVPCDHNLPESIQGEQTSTLGCRCSSFRTECTVGLHTMHMHSGTHRVQNVRVEKCGQRGIEGKYCLHLHHMGSCPACLFRNNAVEFGMQRGLIVHGTHLSVSDANVFYDVRGAAMYVEDGNEMANTLQYNVAVCPWPHSHNVLHGCTVPGTSNGQADTALNVAGIYMLSPTTNLVGNRVAGHFNGMLVDAGTMGRGVSAGKVCTSAAALARMQGNTFHSNGRFGTYMLGNNFPKDTDQSVATDGWMLDMGQCDGFTAVGNDRGYGGAIVNSFDYGTAFVGHYNAGDIQYLGHTSTDNLNLMYWKESKSFADGCSAHFRGGLYRSGNMALPDQGTMIIEDTRFENAWLEANHHCNVGVTGMLCMPLYILHNVTWVGGSSTWVTFQKENTQQHNANQNHGGIFALSPPDAAANAAHAEAAHAPFALGFLLPAPYASLVSHHFSYLLHFRTPSGACVLAASLSPELAARFDGGILCEPQLRPLKVYSRGLASASAPRLLLEVWETGFGSVPPTASQLVGFHQIGSDGHTDKQGYSVPVVPGRGHTYRLSLEGGSPLPADWIIEFSDPVVGNRWARDELQLVVEGRECGEVVTSAHDRRFIWADSNSRLGEDAWGGGACGGGADMAAVECETTPDLQATECPDLCLGACGPGSFCECGSASCQCRPGFVGEDCELDLCGAARCEHGVCSATYLGGEVPVSQAACVCEAPWSGPLCDQNPCALSGRACSGHGRCVAVGDIDAACECDVGYSGDNCEDSCFGFCEGNAGVYPFGCATDVAGAVKYLCGPTGGCSYPSSPEDDGPGGWCVYKTETQSGCVCERPDDCHLSGQCLSDGTCPSPTPRADGTPCNSVPFGVCESGVCTAAPEPPIEPEEPEPCESVCPGAFPFGCNDALDWATVFACNAGGNCWYSADDTVAPPEGFCTYKTVDPTELESCSEYCLGEYPFGCNDKLDDKQAFHCNKDGGCSYSASASEAAPPGWCTYKRVEPLLVVDGCEAVCDGGGGAYPFGCNDGLDTMTTFACAGGGGCWYSADDTVAPPEGFCTYKTVDPTELESCSEYCLGEYPFGCNDELEDKQAFHCNKDGGCSYSASASEAAPPGWCTFKLTVESLPATVTPEPAESEGCETVCDGAYPFGCNDGLDTMTTFACAGGGGCWYSADDTVAPPAGYCIFKTSPPRPGGVAAEGPLLKDASSVELARVNATAPAQAAGSGERGSGSRLPLAWMLAGAGVTCVALLAVALALTGRCRRQGPGPEPLGVRFKLPASVTSGPDGLKVQGVYQDSAAAVAAALPVTVPNDSWKVPVAQPELVFNLKVQPY